MAAKTKRKTTTRGKAVTLAAARSRRPASVRGFEAGRAGRRMRAIPTNTRAINSLIRQYGKNVVARSRYLCSNNGYAISAKEEFVAYVAGTGIVPSPQLKDQAELRQEIREVFEDFSAECDADGITDFYGMQALIAAELYEAGEVFVRVRRRRKSDGLTVPIQLQLLPTEMLPVEYNLPSNSRNGRIEMGIEFDGIGRRKGYWFYTNHPGNENYISQQLTTKDKTFVPADEVYHLFRPIRAGQIRGIPMTVAGMVPLSMLDLYDDAELERKRLAALFGAFITKGLNNADDDDASPLQSAPQEARDDGAVNVSMEPGATVELDWGQDIKFAEPADVGGNFEAFQKRTLLRVAAGFGSTYHGMTGDTSGSSFATMRADQLRLKRRVEPYQHNILVFQFCRKIYNLFMDAAVLAGAIEGIDPAEYVENPRSFRRCKWQTPKWEMVNPVQDVAAEKMMVDNLFKPRSSVIEQMGDDAEEVDEQISIDQKRASEKQIKVVQSSVGVIATPTDEDIETGTEPEPGEEGGDQPGQPAKPRPPANARKRTNKKVK